MTIKSFAAKCLLAVLLLGFQSAAAGPFDNLTAPQLMDQLKFNVEMLATTEGALNENLAIMERNEQDLATLQAEGPRLAAADQEYGGRVSQYNGEVANYHSQCTTSELEEGAYNWCLGWQSGLNSQKSRLDSEASQIQSRFDEYNRRVNDLDRREQDRVWAAEQLVRKYNEYQGNIQSIQLRLNALAPLQQLEGFAERNQECAALENLEAMHQCMQSLWDGARY